MEKHIDADKLIANLERQNVDKKVIEPVIRLINSLQQEQPRPDHYTKVREIKTGKEFWAEYSSEAAEWYEAGTGKAYSISDVEIVKEQQEVDLFSFEEPNAGKTCRTCANRQRWCLGPVRVAQYCGVRSSGRTHNGLLKIKVTNPACGFYKEEENEIQRT